MVKMEAVKNNFMEVVDIPACDQAVASQPAFAARPGGTAAVRAFGRAAPGTQGKTKIRFLGVGLLNTMVGYGIFAGLVFLGLPHLTALLGATVAGVTFNFFSIGRLVFRSRGGRIVFCKFIASYGVVYLMNSTGLEISISRFALAPYLGQALCVPPSILLSWLLMNHWVYKK